MTCEQFKVLCRAFFPWCEFRNEWCDYYVQCVDDVNGIVAKYNARLGKYLIYGTSDRPCCDDERRLASYLRELSAGGWDGIVSAELSRYGKNAVCMKESR